MIESTTDAKILKMNYKIFLLSLFIFLSSASTLAKGELGPALSPFLDATNLARAFEAQKNQLVPEHARLIFKLDSSVQTNLTLANSKAAMHLVFVRGHFKAKWNNDADTGEDEAIFQIYDAAFLIFDAQKKVLLLDQYFSEDGCDGDHIVNYSAKILYFKPKKEQSFFSLDRKMKGDSCAGDNFTRSWTDTAIYFLKDLTSRKLHSYVAYDKKETLAFFPDSDETYVSGLTYQRSDLSVEKNEKRETLDFTIRSVTLQGIEKPVTSKTIKKFSWRSKTESFDESD